MKTYPTVSHFDGIWLNVMVCYLYYIKRMYKWLYCGLLCHGCRDIVMFCDFIHVVALACQPVCACDGQLTGVWLSQAIFTKVIDGTVCHDTSGDLITHPVMHFKSMFLHTRGGQHSFNWMYCLTYLQSHTVWCQYSLSQYPAVAKWYVCLPGRSLVFSLLALNHRGPTVVPQSSLQLTLQEHWETAASGRVKIKQEWRKSGGESQHLGTAFFF